MNYNKKSVEDIDVSGKRVLCRCDFNVPTKDGKITSDKRIVAALPTIEYLIKHGARVILCSHMGKPKNGPDPAFSLQVVADRLSELLGQPVKMASDVVGESAQSLAASLKDGEVMLLENTRFEKGETKNDPELSKKLASLADIFVNDAFGTAHRAHASTAGVADYLPAVCGYLVQKEVSIMGKALADPERPFVAILGGAKVSDKLNVINNLLEKVDTLIIGGGMAYTFLAAKGYGIGKSLFDAEKVDYCKDMMKKAEEKGVKLLLPVDTVVAGEFPNPIDAPFPRFLPTWKAWTSARRPERCLQTPSRAQRPSSGTDPWACLKTRRLPRAPLPLRRRWQTPRQSPSSAAATPQRRASSWALPTRLPTSRPAAARPLNSSRAWSFPELRACRISKLF